MASLLLQKKEKRWGICALRLHLQDSQDTGRVSHTVNKVWSVQLTNKIPWRFHSLLRLSLYVLRTAGWSFMKVRRQKRSLESSFASICLYCLWYDLLLPGVTQGHLRNLNVHFHRAIRWMVPPVGDSLLIGCRNVWQILVGKGGGNRNRQSVILESEMNTDAHFRRLLHY